MTQHSSFITHHSEAAFETVIEVHLLQNGYVSVDREGFDRERAIFPETVLDFIRETQPADWAKLEALHGSKTASRCSQTCASGWTRMARLPRCGTGSSATAARSAWPFQGRA